MKKLLLSFALLLLLGAQTKAQQLDTITATYTDTIYSGYNAACCESGGCLYILQVILPPNFTITKVIHTFSFSSGGCDLDQAGTTISLGTCKTECQSCLIGLPGKCDQYNLIYDAIETCLPSPKCIADTLNFVMDFFRCVSPGGGCSLSCFVADSLWRISVIGTKDSCTTSVIEYSDHNSIFSISPNPATNQLTIHPVGWASNGVNSSLKDEQATVSIMNVLGMETSPPAPLQRRGEDAVIDVSGLSAGMYFLQMKWEGGSVVKKFVKE